MTGHSTKPRSIAWELIVLFSIASALLVACGLGVFYVIAVRHAFAEDNAILADKISALRSDLRESSPNVFAEELKSRRASEHTTYWIRMLDPQGRTYAETPGMDQSLPPEIFPLAQQSSLAVGGRKDYHKGPKLFSLIAFNETSGDQAYTVQLAQDRSSDERVEREFALLFVIVLASSGLASACIAIIVTKRGLRPLEQMTRSLGRVDPTHLKERVAPAGWPRELQPLALAFDDMLKRLDDSFTRLSQFSADLAHELRTPIANMLGEAQVTLTRDRTAPEYRQTIESTVGECERLSRIHFEVTVIDNGCGIAPEHLPQVFDRFYRAESSRGSDGAGLGLALVKSIVDLHGGSASIRSEMGRGTTVRLTFPAVSQRDHGSFDGPRSYELL